MYPRLFRKLVFFAILGALVLITGMPLAADSAPAQCTGELSWITNPSPPGEVPLPPSNPECGFHQFAWQWFLQLVSPTSSGSGERHFETMPMLSEHNCKKKSSSPGSGLFIRTGKEDQPPFAFTALEKIHQAGMSDILYDQNGKVVFYTVYYTQSECEAKGKAFKVPSEDGTGATTELKLSWRIIDESEADDYYTTRATIKKNTYLLGLVGFHLVRNTRNHPEFIWATFEHRSNAPDCTQPQPAPYTGWSFLSSTCAQCLEKHSVATCNAAPHNCKLNTGTNPKTPPIEGGTPSEVCQVDAWGGGTLTNRQNIVSLNKSMRTLFSRNTDDVMKPFANYQLVGTLWLSNPEAQRAPWNAAGSVDLANTTMESFTQHTNFGPASQGKGCFSCHTYSGPSTTTSLSHILPELQSID